MLREDLVDWVGDFVTGTVVHLAAGQVGEGQLPNMSELVDELEGLWTRHRETLVEAPAAALFGLARGLLLEEPADLAARVSELSATQIAALVAADAVHFREAVDDGEARAEGWRQLGLDALGVGSKLGRIALAQGLSALIGLARKGRG